MNDLTYGFKNIKLQSVRNQVRLLLVDDSATTRYLISEALEEIGFKVRQAEDIWIAPIVSEFKPNIILMDLHMGAQNGGVAIRAMKRRSIYQQVKMVLFSSSERHVIEQAATEAGADAFFEKDHDVKTFAKRIQQYANDALAEAAPEVGHQGAML